jgi:DNA-binding MurR/RpiR family transcriptional regulator
VSQLNILNKINEITNFTTNEKIIASYILEYPEQVIEMPIRKFAEVTYTSPSSIVRFNKKLGFSSYKKFTLQLSKDLHDYLEELEYIDANFPFSRFDDEIEISIKIAKLSSETIMQTQKLLNQESLKTATNLMVNASSIYGIGVSHSYNRLMDFHTKLLRIRKYLKLMPLQSDQYHLTNEAKKGDIAVIVSYGGTTAEVLNDAKEFHHRGIQLIAITSNLSGELSQIADVILPLPKRENPEENISTFVSQISIEYVLNTLYSCIYRRDYRENIKNIKSAPTSFLK